MRLTLRTAGQVITPGPVRGYLQRAFGGDLGAAQVAMRTLAEAYPPEEIGDRAYGLYVEFRCDFTTVCPHRCAHTVRDVLTCL